jgi:hypothetical protein
MMGRCILKLPVVELSVEEELHSPNPSRLRAAQRLLQQLDEGAAR